MTTNNGSEKVILITSERTLDGIMIEHYPGKITGKQMNVCTSRLGSRDYIFSSLQKPTLLDFLENYKDIYPYEIRRSSNGELIEANKIEKQPLEHRFLMAIFNYLLSCKETSYISYN